MTLSRGLVLALVLVATVEACGRGERRTSGPPDGSSSRTSQTAADSVWSAGKTRYDAGAYDSAVALWSAGLRLTRQSADAGGQARMLTWLGLAFRKLGNLDSARALEVQALSLQGRPQDARMRWRTLNALGLIDFDRNRNEEAAARFAEALASARAANDPEGVAKVAGNVALAAGNLGDLRGAREGHRAQRAAARQLGDRQTEANGLANEAMLDVWEGNPRPAIARLDTARALYTQNGLAAGQRDVWRQLATAFELTGEYDRAFAALDSSLALARRDHARAEESESLRLLADLHAALGDHRRAVRLFREAEAITRATGAESNLASILRGTASAELALGNSARARAAATEALRLHRASGEPLEQVDDLVLLAEVEARAGDRAAVADRLREGGAIAAQSGVRGARSAVALETARTADALGDARGTLEALRAIDSTSIELDADIGWKAGALAARAWARLGQLDSAVASGRRAVTALETMRGRLPSDMLRAAFVADRADVYADLALVLLRLRRTEEAFVVADAARGRELLSHLGALRGDAAASSAIAATLQQRAELLQRIDGLVERLRRGGTSGRPQRGPAAATTDSAGADVVAQLAAARDEFEALMSRAAERAPRPVAVIGATSLSVARVREALEPGELLVEYLVTRQGLLIFAVDRTGVRVENVDGSQAAGEVLVERVRLLRDLWGTPRPDWRTGLAAAWALDSVLIAPLRTRGLLRGVSHLIVVPHGVLGQVPFSALQDGASGRFLVEDVSLTLLPSAAALPALREHGARVRGVEAADGFAPFDQQLTASAREIASLGTFVRHPRLWTGPRATEAAVRSALAGGSVVHVATHGVLDSRNPMFSHIELASSPGGGSVDDGRLEAHEILSLAVRSPLVFVSGCETGVDWKWSRDPVYGSGEPTLAQALLAAGASHVIATLWRIDDVGASMLAERFYSRLSRVSVAEALMSAQRDLLRDPRYASPYFWAGFTLSDGTGFGADSQFARSASVSPN